MKLFCVCSRCGRLSMKTPNSLCKYCSTEYQAERNYAHLPPDERAEKLANRRIFMAGYNCDICGEPLRGYTHPNIDDKIVCPFDFAEYMRLKHLKANAFLKLISVVVADRDDSFELVEKTVWEERTRWDEMGEDEVGLRNAKTNKWQDEDEYFARMFKSELAKAVIPKDRLAEMQRANS